MTNHSVSIAEDLYSLQKALRKKKFKIKIILAARNSKYQIYICIYT